MRLSLRLPRGTACLSQPEPTRSLQAAMEATDHTKKLAQLHLKGLCDLTQGPCMCMVCDLQAGEARDEPAPFPRVVLHWQ